MEITNSQFVRVWQTSHSPHDVAQKLNVPEQWVYSKAHELRAVGVRLKRLGRKKKKIVEKDELNRIIEEMEGPARRRPTGNDYLTFVESLLG